jgi:hypothetical protein
MNDDAVAPVIAGLAVGITIIVLFGLLFSSAVQSSDVPSNMVQIAKQTDEAKSFLRFYPQGQTFAYPSTGFVEYSFSDSHSGKYSDLRLQIASNNTIMFIQARCLVADLETRSIVDDASMIEKHGKTIPDLNEFLLDERCPRN